MPKREDKPPLKASSFVDVQSDNEYPTKYITPCSEARAGGGLGDGGGLGNGGGGLGDGGGGLGGGGGGGLGDGGGGLGGGGGGGLGNGGDGDTTPPVVAIMTIRPSPDLWFTLADVDKATPIPVW